MAEAYIVEAVRTPVGRRGGGLSQVHPADLGAHSIKALVERSGIDPAAVDDVVFGNVDSIGPNAGDIARTCWLVAGFPEHVPGTTVDRQCGSAQQAVHFAAQAVMSGTMDLVVAGGVQNMSQIPIMSAMEAGQKFGHETPFANSPGWQARYGDQEVSQFRGAEMIAEKWNISRDDMEEFAVESHERALRARAEGRFEHEIVPLGDCTFDEGPREPNWEKIRSLPTLSTGGRLTAALASQISDASSALLIAGEQAVQGPRADAAGAHPPHERPRRRPGDDARARRSRRPSTRSRRRAWASTTSTSSRSTRRSRRSCSAWQQETGFDLAKVNVNGGAIALGHPLGATGARLMTTLLNELERTGGRYGLQTMCEGGGQANVTIIERL